MNFPAIRSIYCLHLHVLVHAWDQIVATTDESFHWLFVLKYTYNQVHK